MKKWWRRRIAPHSQPVTPQPEPGYEPVAVSDTGNARAEREGTAVTGYRGPVPAHPAPVPAPPASAQVSRTGDAIASGPGAFAVSGSLTQVLSRREPVAFPHQVGVLPMRAGCFQDRAAVSALREAVAGGGTAVVCQVLAGMGGVGKTQLAVDHARHAWSAEGADLLVWVTAATRNAVVDAYTQAAVDILAADPADPERAAKEFLAWLEPKSAPGAAPGAPRWLIVLDDVADPHDLDGLWPPVSAHGRTLVTTRRRDAALASHGRLVPVGLFTPAEATEYLQQALSAHGRHESAAVLNALASDLGHLPLALSQAAAYLIDTHLDAATYLGRLADRARQLPDLLPEPGTLPDDQPTTVAAAWALSLDRADQIRPAGLARPMLQLTAMLDPNGIPDGVLTRDQALAHLAAHRTRPRDGDDPTREGPAVTSEEATGALRALHRMSLIDHTPDTPHQAVRVHQLVQRAIRDSLTPDQYHRLARTAADALAAGWPDTERDTDLAGVLRANTTTLAACAEDALYKASAHPVLYRMGTSLGDVGQAVAAVEYFRRITDTADHYLGPDHPDTLTARAHLAHCRGRVDPAGAAEAFAALLEDRVRVLGPDHPQTLTARTHLVYWQGQVFDPAMSAEASAILLEDCLRVLGPDHADTLAARHNLALWRGEAGDPAGAAEAFTFLLEDCLRILGPDHHETLGARHNLAIWRGKAGDPAAAVEAFTVLLEDELRILGPDHPDTLSSRSDLAQWQGEAGDPAGAAEALAALLVDLLRVLGPDHPRTLVSRGTLAQWQGEAGDPAGAAEGYAALLEDRVRVLGPDHVDTMNARHNLAHWRGEAGDPAGAVEALTALLVDWLRVLGPDHPRTLVSREVLAHWQGKAGDPAGAAEGFAALLEDRVRVLGPDHPDTMNARHNLSHWQEEAGHTAGER